MKKMKLVVIAAALVAAVSLSFVSCNSDTTTEEAGVTGIVSGYVIDGVTKKGIEGVTVTVAGHSATTNAAGVYVISGVEPNDAAKTEQYTAIFTKDNYLPAESNEFYVNPCEYTNADPFYEKQLTIEYIGALKASSAADSTNSSDNTSTGDDVTTTYVSSVLTTAMEKVAYDYGITVGTDTLTPLTSGVTGTVYLDALKADAINTTTTKAPAGATISFTYNNETDNVETDDIELGSTTTDENGVFKFYGLPTGKKLGTVKYTVDYTDATTSKYYNNSAKLSTLDNGTEDTLIVNTEDDTTTYFQAGNVFAYLKDIIKCTSDNFTGKVLNVTDSLVLTFDHQLSKLTVVVSHLVNDEIIETPTNAALVNDATANTCTATITPVYGAFVTGSNTVSLEDALALNGSTGINAYNVTVNFVKFELDGVSVVDAIPEASRMAVTASQYLKLECSMEVGRVEDCTVGKIPVDVVIAKDDAKIVYIPFTDSVNSDVDTKVKGYVWAKISDTVTPLDLSEKIDEVFYANQTNYIASTNLIWDTEHRIYQLALGSNLELTFAEDFGTYTDIILTKGYLASYVASTKTMTITKADGTIIRSDPEISITVINGSTTIYSTKNKYFGMKASEAAVSVDNVISFSIKAPTLRAQTTLVDFNKSINTPISLTFDGAVNGYKALLLTSDNGVDYDYVDSTKIIASTTVTSADGKTLTVTPDGCYMYNGDVIIAYYTSNGDHVANQIYYFSEANGMTQAKYLTALSGKKNSIESATVTDDSVRDYNYKAIIKFTTQHANTSSLNGNTYKLYKKTPNDTSWGSPIKSLTYSSLVTDTIEDTGTFKDYDCVNYLLVTSVDNSAKSFCYANFIDITKPTLLADDITQADMTKSAEKWSFSRVTAPTHENGTPEKSTYIIYTSEPITSVNAPTATFANAATATVSAELHYDIVNNKKVYVNNAFDITITSTSTTDTFASTDYISIKFTDSANNTSESQNIYCK